MAGIKIVDLPALGRDLISTDLLELSLAGGTGSRKITGQEIMNASKLSVGNTPIINGAGGQVLFQGTGNVLQESANFTWDNPNQTLYLGGALSFGGNTDQIKASSGSGNFDFLSNLPMRFLRKSGPVELMRIVSSTGNVLINTTTDAGYKLDVNGTFRASDSLIASSSGGGAYKLTVQHTGSGQGNTFRVIQLGYTMIDVNTNGINLMPYPSASGTVGITNWTSLGGSGLTFFTKNSEFTPQGGSQAIPLIKFPNPSAPIVMGATATADLRGYLTVSGGFSATSGLGVGQSLLPSLTATANNDTLVGLDINPTFTNGAFTGVSNLLLRASIAGTTKASITTFGDLILNGVTGANSPSVSVFTSGTSAYFQNYYNPTDNALYWQSVGTYHNTTKMVFRNFQQNTGFVVFSNGNTVLGSNPATVADAGFRLDVNGTARVSGALTLGNGIIFNVDGSTTRMFNSSQINYQANVINGTQHYFVNQQGYNTGTIMSIHGGGAANPSTTGTMAIQQLSGAMSFASGTANYNAVQILTNIQNTGTFSGTIRGFYYNPTVSGSGYSHFAFHSTSGRVRFEGLPTSPTGLNAGDIYNDGGTLKIV